MGNLIKSEFRKIFTTKLWWGLLIPTALVVLGYGLSWASAVNDISDVAGSSEFDSLAESRGTDPDTLPVGLISMGRSINIGLLFPMIFGIFAIAGEYNRKTISTTFLTAPNRGSALTAKMISYTVWGAIYGLVIVAMASIAVTPVDSERLPGPAQWLAVLGAALLASILATLFGVGVGAMWNSVVGSVLTLALYMLIVENLLIILAFAWTDAEWLGGVLPNGTLNGIVGSITAEAFGAAGNAITQISDKAAWGVQYVAGAPGSFAWWASALIFAAWTAAVGFGGWLLNQRRDIT